jgi:hypothetical protein
MMAGAIGAAGLWIALAIYCGLKAVARLMKELSPLGG